MAQPTPTPTPRDNLWTAGSKAFNVSNRTLIFEPLKISFSSCVFQVYVCKPRLFYAFSFSISRTKRKESRSIQPKLSHLQKAFKKNNIGKTVYRENADTSQKN